MAGWIREGLTTLRAPLNKIAYEARRRRAVSRGLPQLPREPMPRLFDFLDGHERVAAERRETDLRERFDLAALRRRSTRREYREALDLLEVLDSIEQHLPRAETLDVVDVGARNWSYVGALDRFFLTRADRVRITGVEVDGHPVYTDGFARCDYARAYARATGNPDVRYEVADFRGWSGGPVDVVTMLYPFVTRYALLAWGLPLGLFDPAAVVRRAVDVLRPGGALVAVHQTMEERVAMLDLLAQEAGGVEILAAEHDPPRLVAHRVASADRQIVVARKPD